MYNVSQAFLAELKQNSRIEHLRGVVGSVMITDENIISCSYSNRASDTKEVSFGLAYVGQIEISLCDVNIPRGRWKNLLIALEYGLEIGDSTVWIPVGKFYISKAVWTDRSINITANDSMTKFDVPIAYNELSGDVYSILSFVCRQCGVNLGMTEAQCQSLPNGSDLLGLYPESDIKTYRDLIGWVASAVGGFCTIDRDGNLVVRSWINSGVVDTFTASDRIAGSAFSDFETSYSGISIVDIEEGSTLYYKEGDGPVIPVGSNPLLQFGSDETKATQRWRLQNVARSIEYTPFTCSLISNPIYDLGDLISMTGGVAGNTALTCCIMQINWTPKALTEFQGFGSDPALAAAKSTTDKKIDGKTGGTSSKDKITVITFTNTVETEINDTWEEIALLRVGVMESQTVQLHGVVKLALDEAGTVFVRYVLNGEPLPFIHICQFPVGEDTITLFLPVAISNEFVNEIGVEIMGDEAVGLIDVGDVQIIIQGVGVTTANWDGYVEAVDEYSFPFRAGISFGYTDTADIDVNSSSIGLFPSDRYEFPFVAGLGFSYSENQNTRINLDSVNSKLTIEDGSGHLQTEDGLNIITEE